MIPPRGLDHQRPREFLAMALEAGGPVPEYSAVLERILVVLTLVSVLPLVWARKVQKEEEELLKIPPS